MFLARHEPVHGTPGATLAMWKWTSTGIQKSRPKCCIWTGGRPHNMSVLSLYFSVLHYGIRYNRRETKRRRRRGRRRQKKRIKIKKKRRLQLLKQQRHLPRTTRTNRPSRRNEMSRRRRLEMSLLCSISHKSKNSKRFVPAHTRTRAVLYHQLRSVCLLHEVQNTQLCTICSTCGTR